MSTLTGVVVSTPKPHVPIDEVVVTATSKELQGEQVVVTQANGSYTIPQLPAGTYTLSFQNENYRPKTFSHIELGEDETKVVNVELMSTGFTVEGAN